MIIIDSDLENPHKRINHTEMRIQSEFNAGPGFAWVTKGREIENYIQPKILEEAVKQVYPETHELLESGPYAKSLVYISSKGKTIDRVDKIKVAREVAKMKPDFTVLDLDQMIRKSIQFIRSSNDFIKTTAH
jgi:hypothetical protein